MTIAEKASKLQEKINRLEDKLADTQLELEALQTECSHEGMKWKETGVSGVETFNCETCGKSDTRNTLLQSVVQ